MINSSGKDSVLENEIVHWKEIRIGIFSLVAIALFIFAILMIGGGGNFWEKKAILHTRFSTLGGLKIASPVTVGGVTAGRVKKINFVESQGHYLVRLDLEVKEVILPQIREDSIAQIKTHGLLGDRYIEITMGQIDAPEIKPGGFIQSSNQLDFDDLAAQSAEFINKLSSLSDEMKTLIHNVNEGAGTLGQLAQDKKLYERTTNLINEIEGLIGEIKKNPKKFFKFSIF